MKAIFVKGRVILKTGKRFALTTPQSTSVMLPSLAGLHALELPEKRSPESVTSRVKTRNQLNYVSPRGRALV